MGKEMLDLVQIQNFRCFRSIGAPLRPLSVLIGPNDSGKSAFLAAIRRMSEQEINFQKSDFWRMDPQSQLLIRAHSPSGWLELRPGALNDPSAVRTSSLVPLGHFRLPSSGIEMECVGREDSQSSWYPGERGEFTAAVIDDLLRRNRRAFDSVVSYMRDLVPGFEDIVVSTPNPNQRRIDITLENGLTIQGKDASAGVKLLLFFVTLALHPSKPSLILLEEPENGIHPQRLADVVALLRRITEGGLGDAPAQVVITTHSPYLLDLIDVERDQVLIFQRQNDGSRSVEAADAPRIARFRDEFSLGEIWLNQFETGLVAKPA